MRHRRGSFRGGPRGGFRGSFRGRNPPGNWPNNSRSWHNNSPNRGPQRESPGKRLKEDEIGVTEYISDHQGFNGIIKSRYSDFQVSEINLQGTIAQLTDTVPPKPPQDAPIDEDEELLFTKYNVEILPNETWDRINKLVVDKSDEAVEIDVTTSSKEDRTKIHEAVKKAFGNAVVGSTVTVDDKKYVRFVKYKKGVRIDKRVKWLWPGEYVYFIVHKENCDTMDAAVKIAEGLRNHIKPSMVGYAGTKDRRAKTSQWFSLRKVDPGKIAAAAGRTRELTVGNFSFHTDVLRLGMLKGNRFRIALRNVTASEEVVSAACSALKQHGFLNYYGLQRFGATHRVPTYIVGRHLLRGEYKLAIDSVLEQNSEPRGNSQYTWRSTEGKLLNALETNPNDFQNALQKIPRNTRLLYLHSYQSLIWNRCLSERVRRLGLRPATGDLVLADKGDVHYTEVKEDNELSDNEETEDQQNVEKQEKEQDVQKPAQRDNFKIKVKTLTEEDIETGSYSICDVIMPLPGFDVEYPPNMVDYYEKLLTEDGLTLSLNKNKNKNYNLCGAYRHIVVKPEQLSWESVRYSDPYADLVPSDLDLMHRREMTGILPDGKYSALVVQMSLPPSSYATMALRELLKADTSSHAQAQGNLYHTHTPDNKRTHAPDTDSHNTEKKHKVDE